MVELVEHHIKYKEIHGVDETIWLTRSEHKKLHLRLRREGRCKIPVDDLSRIADRAFDRTKKARERHKKYNQNVKRYVIVETMLPYCQLVQTISYNLNNGVVSVGSSFRCSRKRTHGQSKRTAFYEL